MSVKNLFTVIAFVLALSACDNNAQQESQAKDLIGAEKSDLLQTKQLAKDMCLDPLFDSFDDGPRRSCQRVAEEAGFFDPQALQWCAEADFFMAEEKLNCLRITKDHTFNHELVTYCRSNPEFFDLNERMECLKTGQSRSFAPSTINFCATSATLTFPSDRTLCLMAVAGKRLDESDLSTCGKAFSPDALINCLEEAGKPDPQNQDLLQEAFEYCYDSVKQPTVYKSCMAQAKQTQFVEEAALRICTLRFKPKQRKGGNRAQCLEHVKNRRFNALDLYTECLGASSSKELFRCFSSYSL